MMITMPIAIPTYLQVIRVYCYMLRGIYYFSCLFIISLCFNHTSFANNINVDENINNVVKANQNIDKTLDKTSIVLGIDQENRYLPLLRNKKVALVVNQTSIRRNGQHLVDYLLANNIDVRVIFAPEHGFRGDHDAGAKVNSSIDQKTAIPLLSLYGKSRKPSAQVMAKLDVLLFDIQDVGVRYYTYISTLHYVMEAVAQAGKKLIILDRPNPNIAFIDGPMLSLAFRSFVGMDTIPLLHGMTVGELAKMLVGEKWLAVEKNLDLTVIPLANYQRNTQYSLPIKPSPNLPNDRAIALYPSLGFFEATAVSIGRGTEFPFQVIGHDKVKLGQFTFTPKSTPNAALKPKLMNKQLYGLDLRNSSQRGLNLHWFYKAYYAFKKAGVNFITHPKFLDKLAGSDKFRKALQAGKSLEEIKQSWQQDLENFKKQRKPYLLYP